MNKIILILLKFLKSKVTLKIVYYFLFFIGSILIFSGLGNIFSSDMYDEFFGIIFLTIGLIIIILLWKHEKIF
jgi:hypothetical protein